MHRIAYLLLCLLTAGVPSFGKQNSAGAPRRATHAGASREADCRRFVQSFYSWYRRSAGSGGYDVALKRRSGLFDRQLLRALREDLGAQRKSPDEVVGLDFDPLLNSQDIADRYDVAQVSAKGKRYFAEVYGRYGSAKAEGPAVVPELRFQGGRWVFVNFHYRGAAPNARAEDLLTMLGKLRHDRAKKRSE